MRDRGFWNQKKVFITGHTGFKGAWLTLWLASLGAEVFGYSLLPPSHPYLFEIVDASNDCRSCRGDINDYPHLLKMISAFQPQIIFHMAAQPLVRKSYQNPIETFQTNVLGTVHLLEAARQVKSVRVFINVTSDKCYENDGLGNRSFRESDRFGGYDPYSASKGCAEIVTESYRKSFLSSKSSVLRLASVRAGNVIGGGDWAEDRLFPDLMRACIQGQKPKIRNPQAVRPWQHVLEPLNGYLLLAERLWENSELAEGWNFGPGDDAFMTVWEIVNRAMQLWGRSLEIDPDSSAQPYESRILKLDSTKAEKCLGWNPKLSIKESVEWTVQWYKKYEAGEKMRLFTLRQIEEYEHL